MVVEMDYADLHFNNIQLVKLVSSAEIIFQHLYDLVSVENKIFIDQWFCYKQEYDEACINNSQFDVNENVQECPTLSRIDEVSENEKISISSISSISSSSSVSLEKADKRIEKEELVKEEIFIKSCESPRLETDIQMSQVDSDLLEYMTEFKLFTDGFVSDWFKTLSFNTSEIKQYMNWLENKEYKRIWTDIYNNARKNSELNRKYADEDSCSQVDNFERGFVPIETSHTQFKPLIDQTNLTRRNSINRQYNINNMQYEPFIDQHIHHLQEIRHLLLRTREKMNNKFKKDELKSSVEFKDCLKTDVAFEIIDISIEMKNQLKLGHGIPDLNTHSDEVDAIIADCLRVLSVTEIRYVLMTYLINVIDMRKSSSEYDKQVLKLDSEISNQKFLIWRLYMMVNENKRSYENQCLTLHKEFEQKLHLMGRTTTDESNDDSLNSTQGRKLLSIIEKNDLQDSSHSDFRETKDTQTAISCIQNIPEKSLKTLQSTSGPSSATKVTRHKKKLIIQTKKC